jgi:predicted methyltransferase
MFFKVVLKSHMAVYRVDEMSFCDFLKANGEQVAFKPRYNKVAPWIDNEGSLVMDQALVEHIKKAALVNERIFDSLTPVGAIKVEKPEKMPKIPKKKDPKPFIPRRG